jgi:hypothetical protein
MGSILLEMSLSRFRRARRVDVEYETVDGFAGTDADFVERSGGGMLML